MYNISPSKIKHCCGKYNSNHILTTLQEWCRHRYSQFRGASTRCREIRSNDFSDYLPSGILSQIFNLTETISANAEERTRQKIHLRFGEDDDSYAEESEYENTREEED